VGSALFHLSARCLNFVIWPGDEDRQLRARAELTPMTQSRNHLWLSTSLAAAAVVALCLGSAPVRADDIDELEDKMERIERDLRQLEYDVHKGNPPSGDASVLMSGSLGTGSGQRLNDVENSLRDLRGQVETLTYQVRQLTEQLDIARKESNYRISALEGGAPAGPIPATTGAAGGPITATAPKPAAAPGGYGAPIKIAPGAGSDQQGRGPGTLGSIPAGAAPAAEAGLSPQQQYDAAMDLLSRAQYAEAQTAFRGFVAAHPADPLAGPAQYWVGDISFTQKDYGAAAKSFAELLKRYSKTARAPDAMLKLGLSLLELGQKKEGCTTLGALKSKYPNANKAVLDRAAKRAAEAGCK
jgi:tol-pal system protein YbgF